MLSPLLSSDGRACRRGLDPEAINVSLPETGQEGMGARNNLGIKSGDWHEGGSGDSVWTQL